MPDLTHSLQGRDLGHLRIVAELWGLELSAPDARVGLQRLAPLLLDAARVAQVINDLPQAARLALQGLAQGEADGSGAARMSWALFTRRYGPLREVGPARRDRERPHLDPGASPVELLWYRALVARAFFDTPSGPQEFAYIPDDLLALLPALQAGEPPALGRPASPSERLHPLPAGDRILDHACTLLAALRMGQPLESPFSFPPPGEGENGRPPLTPAVLQRLLSCAGLLDPSGVPLPEPTRLFLDAPRGEALAMLVKAWRSSPDFNELRLLPGLEAEGEWRNDPLRARTAILAFLNGIPGLSLAPAGEPARPFWSLPGFVSAIRQRNPDFQRPAGDYDSWHLRRASSVEFLRGFEHWDEVDGALIRYLICGPLFWLGIVDLAAPAPGAPPAAFRISAWGKALLAGQPAPGMPPENAPVQVLSDARLRAPRLAPRSARYQIARAARWEGETDREYLYRLTPASLDRARKSGLRVSHLVSLLRRCAPGIPPPLARALERWDERGSEARFERQVILRLSSPDLLAALRSSRAARFLGDPLGPTAVIVKPGAWEKVMAVLAEMGYLGDGVED